MLNNRFRGLGIALLGAALLTGSLAASRLRAGSTTGPTEWMSDYGQARNESRRLGLPLVIHFGATWCGPCRQMERETLHSPGFTGLLGTKMLALKIDSDENPGLLSAFRVKDLPSDIIVAPDGRIVARNAGYQGTDQYLATIGHWSGQFQKERAEALARLSPPPPARTPADLQRTQPQPQPPSPGTSNQFVQSGTPDHGNPAGDAGNSSVAQTPPTTEVTPLVGMEGYCPVQIRDHRRWVRGQAQFIVNWYGVAYYLSDADSFQAFNAEPQKYAPRMLGCDPVELLKSNVAVQGSVQYGAFFDRELYLFRGPETRDQFKRDPERFTRIRHALRSEDVIGTRLR